MPTRVCPSSEQLRLFVRGVADEETSDTILRHAETCVGCAALLDNLLREGDSLIGRHIGSGLPITVDTRRVRGPQEESSTPTVKRNNRPDNSEPLPGRFMEFLSPAQSAEERGRLGNYRILEILGHGGMGVVFLAEDLKLKRRVALKAMLPVLAASASAGQRFLREAQTMASIKHDHVVTIYHVDEERGIPFFAMELLTGEPLDKRLERQPRLALLEVVRIGREIAAGLAAAHEHGLIHRDIKPGNIWLEHLSPGPLASPHPPSPPLPQGARGVQVLPAPPSPLVGEGGWGGEGRWAEGRGAEGRWAEGRVKILDFGLARAIDDASITQPGGIAGTPLYMSPEQARGEYLDPRSDLFSLGSVLYEMCTGDAPFPAGNTLAVLKRVCEDNPQPIREVNPDMPGWLAEIVHRLLAKAQADRFQSAAELAERLGRHLAELQHPVLSVAPLEAGGSGIAPPASCLRSPEPQQSLHIEQGPAGRPRGRWWRIAAGLVFVLGAALALLWGLLPHPPRFMPIPRQQPPEGTMPATFVNRFGMEFVRVPRGRAWLGGGGTAGGEVVEIPYDFYLGRYEVTQGQWEAVTGRNPSHFSRKGKGNKDVEDISDEELKQFPVETVAFPDVQSFVNKLNEEDKEAGWAYSLPLKDEWEYACRGGPMKADSESAFHFYLERPANQLLAKQANFGHQERLKRPCRVGSYPPNRLGIHDMHGNVREWCHAEEPSPHGMPSPVIRGGGWSSSASVCRAAHYEVVPPVSRRDSLGVRLARVFVGQGK